MKLWDMQDNRWKSSKPTRLCFQKEIRLEYLTDSVKIEHYYPNEIHENSNGSSTITYVKYKYPSSNDLKIFVDTSKIIGSGMDRRSTYGMTEEDILSYNFRGKYKSHPVFIENISNDTLSIGFGNRIFPIVEAKDSLGNWRPIQERGILTMALMTWSECKWCGDSRILISETIPSVWMM